MSKRILIFLLVFSLFVASAYAYQATPSSWTKETDPSARGLAKFKFGLTNLFLGWTEIFTEPYEAWESHGNIFKGVAKGIIYGAADTVGGALHIATCPIPMDVPLPEGGTDVLKK